MKTILVVTDEDTATQSITKTCNDWQEQYSILSVKDETAAKVILEKTEVALIICDTASRPGTLMHLLQQLTYAFPYIPVIAIINPVEHAAEDILRLGISSCLETPFKGEELRRWASELLEVSTSGTVKGLPIHSLLQMLEGESKTCTLKVSSGNNFGFIFMDKGAVIAAESAELKNEDAVYTIVAWDDTTAEIRFYNSQREAKISRSLMSLIMEAFRLKDERESLTAQQKSQNKPKMELKHFSTAGQRLSLENGLRIKLEIDNSLEPFSCSLIGMLADKYIIVSKPADFEALYPRIVPEVRIVAKYLQMGRLCMFKTELIHALEKPDGLLFLEYPQVLHYHELRRAKRMVIFVPSTLQLPSGPKYTSVLLDLSNTGCLCQIRSTKNKSLPNLDIGSKVFLYCLFPGVKDELELTGIVKNTKKSNTELRIGIELVDLKDRNKEAIVEYLISLEN